VCERERGREGEREAKHPARPRTERAQRFEEDDRDGIISPHSYYCTEERRESEEAPLALRAIRAI